MAAQMARRRFAAKGTLPMAAAGTIATAAYVTVHQQTLKLEGEARPGKLPIYSAPPENVTLVEVRGPLEDQVAQARKAVLDSTHSARSFLRGYVDRWIGVEKSVETRVSSLIPNDEPLTPNILYVGVATLAGSVFTRYRSFPLRVLTPPVFLVASMRYLLPKTSHNISQYYLELEGRHFPPAMREQRENMVRTYESLRSQAGSQAERVKEGSGDLFQRGLKGVEESTGLRVAGGSHNASKAGAASGDASRMV